MQNTMMGGGGGGGGGRWGNEDLRGKGKANGENRIKHGLKVKHLTIASARFINSRNFPESFF